MQKVIKQILESIDNTPEEWSPCNYYTGWDGVKNDDVVVGGAGNTKYLSIINVKIKGLRFQLSYIEKFHLEKAVINWYKHCNLAALGVE